MSEPSYTVDHFLAKFSAIPEDQWCEGGVGVPGGRRCALGHCDYSYRPLSVETAEAQALIELFRRHVSLPVSCHHPEDYVIHVNDAWSQRLKDAFPQPTPKLRILAALEDVKRKETK